MLFSYRCLLLNYCPSSNFLNYSVEFVKRWPSLKSRFKRSSAYSKVLKFFSVTNSHWSDSVRVIFITDFKSLMNRLKSAGLSIKPFFNSGVTSEALHA